MSKIQIENPKVFISYAWGTKEYQDKVLAFATDLVGDGIDVVLDKWSLKEGNDTYAFMEQSVNDQTVTNVLLLLDPEYEKRANDRNGGVGTETQIISAEIYNKTNQDKFLPIIFERNMLGEVPKPTYLRSLLHFDLSNIENYDSEYQRLVKTLYGVEIYKKPELGKKPDWLEVPNAVGVKTKIEYDALKTNTSEKIKRDKFLSFLNGMKERIINYKKDVVFSDFTLEKYLELYSETFSIRNEYLNLIKNSLYVEESEKLVSANLESICEELYSRNGYIADICKTLLHEIFIYVIAIYYKNRNYTALSYILTKTFFVNDVYGNFAQSFQVFYHHDPNLDNAVNKRDDKKYHSGTAQYWIDTLNNEICSKHDFVFADILLYNTSVYSNNYLNDWYWFPLSYVYAGYHNKYFRIFSGKLCSREHLLELAQIMGYDDIEEFKRKFEDVATKYKSGKLEAYGFSQSFEKAPLLCHYVKSTDLGIYK